MRNKGFIGSIGDDLPSLIPLFFALMIFFGALAFAFTTINEKNATINTYVDSLTIARSALSDGAFANLEEFNATQSSFVTLSNYMYGLIYLPNNNDDSLEFNFEELFQSDIRDAFIKQCVNNKDVQLAEELYVTEMDSRASYESSCGDAKEFLIASQSAMEKINDPNGGSAEILNQIKHTKYFYYLYPVTILTPAGQKIVYLLVLVW